MDSLYDYILWLGEYPFTVIPFREVDAVILCQLAYFDFAPLFKQAGVVHLRDSQAMIDAGEVRVEQIGKPEPFVRILEAAASSRRFGDLLMTGYVDIMVAEDSIQFSAITFHCDAGEAGWSFLAYRGTDSSLAGWKEDFMISFKRTYAQELARQYAENRIDSDHTWYLGGHSKGGNLALYAACMLSDKQLASVRRVYLLDGPGFSPEVVDPAAIDRIESLVTRIIPGFSVIGRLFEPQIENTWIVQSSYSGLLQHDLVSWGIDHGKLALLQQTTSGSDIIHRMLKQWISNIPYKDREIFINDIFDALGASGAETLEELHDQGHKALDAIRKRLRDSNEITKNILKDLTRQAIQAVKDALFRK